MERVVFDGRVNVDYNQILVEAGERAADFSAAFSGQENGLVGAGEPGCLILITGTHTGDVGLRVVLHDDAPPVDSRWEDIVEATFIPAGPEATLFGLMSNDVCVFALPASSYRVRWSGTGMDEAYDGTVGADETLIDTFELAFWPAAPMPAEIVRQASQRGREAHLASTPEGRAQIARQFEQPEWSGGSGGEVQRRAARGMVDLDRAFADRLGAATEAQLVAVRNRVVRFVCVELGTARLPWVASALDDLEAGRPLPTSFNPGTVYGRLDLELSNHRDRSSDHPEWAKGGWSLFMAIRAAGEQTDSLDGALEAILNGFAAFGRQRDSDVLDEVLGALDT
ncbi:MAG: hypothetical protein HGA44_20625 [Cellulomonadaceae bacterium]|nr:hypothetical protein [Cellulomonadaceae bacterium]